MKILGFPGMGKTELAKTDGQYYDLDFDYLRMGHDERAIDPLRLCLYAEMANKIEKQDFIVLLNEPQVLFTKIFKVDKMILPEGFKMIQHCANKLGVSLEEVYHYLYDWEFYAWRMNVPVIHSTAWLKHAVYADPDTRWIRDDLAYQQSKAGKYKALESKRSK